MATLTQTAFFSKRVINVSATIFGIFIIVLVALRYGKIIKNAIFPPPPPPATVAFGKIPPANLAEGTRPSGNIKYELETITGELPMLPKTAKVFKLGGGQAFFGDLEQTKINAASIGFIKDPIEINGNIVKFLDQGQPGRNLVIDMLSGNFTLDSIFRNDPKIVTTRLKSLAEAVDKASQFLEEMEIEQREYPRDRAETIKFRLENGQLIDVPSLSQANIVQVNFFRADLGELGVFGPQYRQSKVRVLVSSDEVVAAQVERSIVQRHRFAAYPLKSPDVAWGELKSGKGALNREPAGIRIPIREVVLGYIDMQDTGFLQPVYVFKSDAGLIAYVAAVDEKWLQSSPN